MEILKGCEREYIVAFASRVSLRLMPLITARLTIGEIWLKSSTQNLYAVIRANLLLQVLRQKENGGGGIGFGETPSARAANAAAKGANFDYAAAYHAAGYATFEAHSHAFGYDRAAYYIAYAAAGAAVEATSAAVREVSKGIRSLLIQAILEDLEQLRRGNACLSLPLWPQTSKDIEELHRRFLTEVKSLGLGFLAQDVQKVWDGEFLGKERLALYEKYLSEEIASDPVKLSAVFDGQEETARNNAIRIMLVGPGGAGKTSLHDLLLQRKTEGRKYSTIGIGCNELDPVNLGIHKDYIDLSGTENLDIYLWDFGGQSIFHNLHRGFIRKENCVYVLVVDSRHEQAPDEWLAQINEYTGDESVPVLLVTNCYEDVNREQNQNRLLRQYPNLLTNESFTSFSCIDATDKFDKFLSSLITTSTRSQREITETSFNAISKAKKLLSKSPFADEGTLSNAIGVEVTNPKWKTIKKDLIALGQIVVVDTNGKYCLDANWIVQKAYQVINDRRLFESGGIVESVALIHSILGEYVNGVNESEMMLSFLEKHKATHKLALEDESIYFFPDAAQQNEPTLVRELLEGNQRPIVIEYQFDPFPLGFKSHFTIQMLKKKLVKVSQDKEKTEVWRDGLIARFDNGKVTVLVEYLVAKQKLNLKFFGDNPASYNKPLKTIHNTIADIIDKDKDLLVPQLVDGLSELDHEAIGELFKQITVYEQISRKEQGMTVIKDSFNNNQQAQIVTGDHASATANNSRNVNEKEVVTNLLEALELAKKEMKDYEAVLSEMKAAVEQGKAEVKDERFKNVFSKVWTLAKEGNTADTIYTKLVEYLPLIPPV